MAMNEQVDQAYIAQQIKEAQRYRYLKQFVECHNLSMEGLADWEVRIPWYALGRARTFDEAVEKGMEAQKPKISK